jgi:hypothetical protein
MRHWFDNPHLLRQAGLMDAVLRGLVDQWPQNMDEWVSEDVTNHLFQRYKWLTLSNLSHILTCFFYFIALNVISDLTLFH